MSNKFINHKNGNKMKNNLDNLEVISIEDLSGKDNGIIFTEVSEEEKESLLNNIQVNKNNTIREDEGKDIK